MVLYELVNLDVFEVKDDSNNKVAIDVENIVNKMERDRYTASPSNWTDITTSMDKR